jgi:foldase protein PrsA
MALIRVFHRRSLTAAGVLIAICGMTHSVAAPTDSSSQAAPSPAVFATDANAGANAEKMISGAAAVVDDHIIPMEDVILACLRQHRSHVIDQMIQSYVLDRECEKRGITVSESEIDKRIEELRESLAPDTLEETLKRHRMSTTELRHKFRQDSARKLLVADRVRPLRMVHCQEILLKCGPDRAGTFSTRRTEAEALAVAKDIQLQFKQGKDFRELAARYSESEGTNGVTGDLGVLYENMLGLLGQPVLDAAMALHKGEVSTPVKGADGIHLLYALGTRGDHSETENSLYANADKASRDLQIRFLVPTVIVGLMENSKITLVDDSALVAGKPLPDAAAVVDGHAIPLNDVIASCLDTYGPKMVDILVQNYVVDRECVRRGIGVSDAEIDRRIGELREQIAPMTLDEGLKRHHTTMDGLRRDFRQEIERTRLAIEQVKPTKLVRARVIFIKVRPAGMPGSVSGARRTDAEARMLIASIQAQLKAGTTFEALAKQYSEMDDRNKDGELTLYEGKRDIDTAMINAALKTKKGEISPAPIEAHEGCFLIQTVSTSDDHATDEDGVYADAFAVYAKERAQSLIPQVIVDLIKKSRVVYYVHS